MIGWRWRQLDHMQIICTSLQTDNHASTSPLSFYQPDALPATQRTASKYWRCCTAYYKTHTDRVYDLSHSQHKYCVYMDADTDERLQTLSLLDLVKSISLYDKS